jgi:hypothetical protein
MKVSNKSSFANGDTTKHVIWHTSRYAIAALLIVPILYGQANASGSNNLVQIIDPQIKSQLWINPGMVSYHFQQDKNFNNGNWGAGLEYRFNTVASLTAGRFYNSDRNYSNYAGVYYQPIAIGPIKVGAVFGGFNGYPNTNNGGWFAAALPALTWEGDWAGVNVFVIPTIGEQVHGAISLQLKLKVFEQKEQK